MRGDRSALGTLPTAAYQYCEPVRTASAFGWYIFPPVDIRLKWDGAETFYHAGEDWRCLVSEHLDEDFVDLWDSNVPGDLKGRAPPFLSGLFVPGIVQVWSGFFVSSARDWSVLIRPVANVVQSRAFACYEGIIESDRFKPMPLFVNIRLIATDAEIVIPKLTPLFQVQPIHRESYSEATLTYSALSEAQDMEGDIFGMSPADWDGFRTTIRDIDPRKGNHSVGSYGARVRRRAKQHPN